MGKIATEYEARTIGGQGTAETNRMCTKARAIALGCAVASSYSDNQLVQYEHLSKALTTYWTRFNFLCNNEYDIDHCALRFNYTLNNVTMQQYFYANGLYDLFVNLPSCDGYVNIDIVSMRILSMTSMPRDAKWVFKIRSNDAPYTPILEKYDIASNNMDNYADIKEFKIGQTWVGTQRYSTVKGAITFGRIELTRY